jgi:hypothetical protein
MNKLKIMFNNTILRKKFNNKNKINFIGLVVYIGLFYLLLHFMEEKVYKFFNFYNTDILDVKFFEFIIFILYAIISSLLYFILMNFVVIFYENFKRFIKSKSSKTNKKIH